MNNIYAKWTYFGCKTKQFLQNKSFYAKINDFCIAQFASQIVRFAPKLCFYVKLVILLQTIRKNNPIP